MAMVDYRQVFDLMLCCLTSGQNLAEERISSRFCHSVPLNFSQAPKCQMNCPGAGETLHCFTLYRWGVHNCGKSPFLMGKSPISMAIFNSYANLPEGNYLTL